ncbi:DEAD/DEAH box helicase [Clostridium septicum]|uniref:ATP-dependent helicase n=1 Tax=Clostridium septicum TaxID=1504 RepID=A0A9N7PM94_CLOSE|nr:DEAD/DEAH box helicase [Clostridium septicum]AYE35536.1 ATP-dependent helicase [Clostridium septicum]MDU1314590.1 DEAD/DEAH box helicase [Clostridium septicum]QAS60923.1 DEAD/DEAH box helicase [Clostridium septicum]UEC19803.1 DEAD/DEAH box helicase [Clostridium septicum]USS02138.1 DEAD/DEAH box helicase [Clostridium septicum]
MNNFNELSLKPNIVEALKIQGITEPTEIQSKAIPELLKNKDLIGESHTGSGKTLAYLLPIFEKINSEKREMQSIILAPTHELVRQIEEEIKLLSKNSKSNITSLTVIGDVNIDRQIKKIKEVKPHIIVGSPGRVLDLIRKKKITAHTIKTIVIDEADNLLDKNNYKIILDIIKTTMRDRQLMVFSATISDNTMKISKELMKEPVVIKATGKPALNPKITHMYIEGDRRDKFEILRKLIAAINPNKSIVFVNNNTDIDIITQKLNYHGKPAFNISSHISKEARQKSLQDFRNGKINILVSSDLSARGLDVPDVTHIFNLDFPVNANDYLHRAGRTARGENSGVAISIATGKDLAGIRVYEREFNIKIHPMKVYNGKLMDAK